VYERVKPHFSEPELIDLTLAVANFRTVAGDYRPGMYKSYLKEAGAPARDTN